MCDLGVSRIGPEAVFLVVGAAEDPVTESLDGEHAEDARGAEMDRVDGEISGLKGVDEGQPDEVAKGEHEAEAVGGDVNGRQHRRFHIEGVEDVEGLKGDDEEHAVADEAVESVLVREEGEVEEDPAEHAGPEFHEGFDVDGAREGEGDAGVEFAPDEPVVDEVAAVTAGGEFAVVAVRRLDGEAGDVDVGCQGVGDDEVCGQDGDVVVPEEGPEREIGALEDRSGAGEDEDGDGGGECLAFCQ